MQGRSSVSNFEREPSNPGLRPHQVTAECSSALYAKFRVEPITGATVITVSGLSTILASRNAVT
jgi:hypothetical protein